MPLTQGKRTGHSQIPWQKLASNEVEEHDKVPPLLQLPFRHLSITTVSLPLLAFIFCILWSLWFDFDRSTFTHCNVANYLPSVSSSIGGYKPQLYVWRICIGLHAAPRFLVAVMYGKYYQRLLVDEPLWQRVGKILAGLHCIENSCLVGLTYVSSTDYYPAHEKFFVLFVISAFSYMLLSTIVPRIASRKKLSVKTLKVLHIKLLFTLTNFTGAGGAIYFFVRHNNYCEPGMYTMFALCEYIVVLSNMAFHMCAFWDFGDQVLSITGFKSETKDPKVHEIHIL